MSLTLTVEHQALIISCVTQGISQKQGPLPLLFSFSGTLTALSQGGMGKGTQGQMTLLALARDSLRDLEK